MNDRMLMSLFVVIALLVAGCCDSDTDDSAAIDETAAAESVPDKVLGQELASWISANDL